MVENTGIYYPGDSECSIGVYKNTQAAGWYCEETKSKYYVL